MTHAVFSLLVFMTIVSLSCMVAPVSASASEHCEDLDAPQYMPSECEAKYHCRWNLKELITPKTVLLVDKNMRNGNEGWVLKTATKVIPDGGIGVFCPMNLSIIPILESNLAEKKNAATNKQKISCDSDSFTDGQWPSLKISRLTDTSLTCHTAFRIKRKQVDDPSCLITLYNFLREGHLYFKGVNTEMVSLHDLYLSSFKNNGEVNWEFFVTELSNKLSYPNIILTKIGQNLKIVNASGESFTRNHLLKLKTIENRAETIFPQTLDNGIKVSGTVTHGYSMFTAVGSFGRIIVEGQCTKAD